MEQKIVKITATTLNGLRPGRARLLRDEQCPNLLVAVSKRAVTWKFKAERRDPSKPKGWATQSATLGPIVEHTPERARAWAYGLLSKTKAGVNPNSRADAVMTGWTVSDLWVRYAEDLTKRGKDTYNHAHYGKLLTDLWAKPIRELTREDVKALHAAVSMVGISGRPAPTSANRVRECLCAALNFAIEERQVETNVAFASRRLRNPERKRNESIPLNLLPHFWAEVAKLPSPVRAAFHSIVLLLGLRLKTAKELRWDWIDLDDASLTIPDEAMKMRNGLWLPLPREGVEILRGLPRVSYYVFAVRTRDQTRWTHIAEEKEDGPLKPYVGGKLRSTYRTAHVAIRTPSAHAEQLHGHVTRGIAAHYIDETQMRDDLRKYQQAVATFLQHPRLAPSAAIK